MNQFASLMSVIASQPLELSLINLSKKESLLWSITPAGKQNMRGQNKYQMSNYQKFHCNLLSHFQLPIVLLDAS